MPSNLHRRRGHQARNSSITNGIVDPGRPITKAEREARKDSALGGYADYDKALESQKETPELLESGRVLISSSRPRQKWTRHDIAHVVYSARWRLHDLICLAIGFLIVFGALWSLLEYLLAATRVSAQSQCTASTVFLPVTETVTQVQYLSAPSSSELGPVASSLSPVPALTTILTTTIPVTKTVTVLASLSSPSSSAIAGQASTSGPLSYIVDGGTTSWLGASPSSGVSIVFASTVATVTVVPTPPSAVPEKTLTTTIKSTMKITVTETVLVPSEAASNSPISSPIESTSASSSLVTPTATVPPFTSTVFSIVSPDSTTTLTRTRFTTVSLSRVSPHPSFTGIQSNGWNTTSAVEMAQSVQPTTRTYSELYYFGTGNATTSTSTSVITTTIGATIIQTFSPTPFVASISGSLTTMTGAPVTITYTVQAEPSATTISIPDVSAGPSQSLSVLPVGTGSSAALPAGMTSATVFSYLPLQSTGSAASSSTLQTGPPQPSGAPLSSSIAGPLYSNSSSSVQDQPSPTSITVTSFISGHGTTFVVTSTPSDTIPHSPLSPTSSAPTDSTWTLSSASTGGAGSPPGYGIISSSTTAASNLVDAIASSSLSESGSSNLAGPALSASPRTTSTTEVSKLTSTSHGSSTTSIPAPPGYGGGSSKSSARTQSTGKPASITSATRTSSSSFSNHFPATSATAIPSHGCGEQGPFEMTFDDLPRYSPTKRQWNQTNTTDITQYPPLNQRPYHHLLFSGGYVYAPNPAEPFAPASPPNVAAFVEPNVLKSRPGSLPNATEPGEIGEPAHGDDNPSFWFDPQSAYLGCDNDGPDDCTIEATGYQYSPQVKDEVPGPQQNYTMAPCIGYKNCKLQRVNFPHTFNNLSGIQFRAFVDNKPRMFFVDNLNMRWSNDSCAAGMERQGTR